MPTTTYDTVTFNSIVMRSDVGGNPHWPFTYKVGPLDDNLILTDNDNTTYAQGSVGNDGSFHGWDYSEIEVGVVPTATNLDHLELDVKFNIKSVGYPLTTDLDVGIYTYDNAGNFVTGNFYPVDDAINGPNVTNWDDGQLTTVHRTLPASFANVVQSGYKFRPVFAGQVPQPDGYFLFRFMEFKITYVYVTPDPDPDPDPDPPTTPGTSVGGKRPVRMYPRMDSRAFQGFR